MTHRLFERGGQWHARQLHALGGGVLLASMMLDEVIVGGVGSGLFGMLLSAIVAVFVAGLTIDRTPEPAPPELPRRFGKPSAGFGHR